MVTPRRLFLFVVFLLAPVFADAQTCSNFTVGYQVVQFGTMNVAVWYPSTSPEAPYTYLSATVGSAALNGTPAPCTGLPMTVFSHGYSGCGTQSVFITEQLARNGYVVAAPDHADAGCSVTNAGSTLPPEPQQPFTNPSAWTAQTYYDRRVDIENTINGMLASPAFGPMIDPQRISGMGHSLGGYTILGMIGAWPTWLEPRIKAALLFSPYLQPFLNQATLPKITAPIQYQGGTLDFGITPWVAMSGGGYDQAQPPKFFAELSGVGHLAWTNGTCNSAGTVAACLATSSIAQLIDQYGFAFLDRFVLGTPEPLLWGAGAGLANYRHEASLVMVNAASNQAGPVAAAGIATLYTEGLPASATPAADPLHPPVSLGGLQVNVSDGTAASFPAELYYVSPGQINFVIPAAAKSGAGSVTVAQSGAILAAGPATIVAVAPGLFPTGQTLYATASGQTFANLTDPIHLGSSDVFLIS
jgi:dienelactone hydrolase